MAEIILFRKYSAWFCQYGKIMVMNNNIQRHITSSSKEMDVEEHSKWNPPDGDGVFHTRAQAKTAISETTTTARTAATCPLHSKESPAPDEPPTSELSSSPQFQQLPNTRVLLIQEGFSWDGEDQLKTCRGDNNIIIISQAKTDHHRRRRWRT